jgi:predicted nucleic acid-binding protein
MAASALIDTGAILAILDSQDAWHIPCRTAFRQLRVPLLTSEAVFTEVFHLTGANRAAMKAAWTFLRSGTIVLGPIQDAELPQLRSLMLQDSYCGPGGFCDVPA